VKAATVKWLLSDRGNPGLKPVGPGNDRFAIMLQIAVYFRSDPIYAAMSAASVRLNGKLGILGCGSRRKNATFSGVKSDFRAIAANGGTSALACF
jgi:hypothetical protein